MRSRPFAAAAAFNARLNEAFDETASTLRTHGDEMVRELRAAPSEMRANLDVHFVPMLELCTLVLGAEEAALIRRRARMTAAA